MPLARSTVLAFSVMGSMALAQPQQPPAQPAKPAAPAPTAASENKVVTTDTLHLLVLPMKGSYMQHPAAFERLGGFLAAHGATPVGAPVARYFSDPSVAEANLTWEVGFPVAATVKAEVPFEIKDIPATLTAVHVHKGSLEELAQAWPAFMQWVISNGYRPAGPPMNVFMGDPGSNPQVELRVPVEK